MITIVNYGMGNLGSIQNMLKYIGVPCIIASDVEKIKCAEKLLLPGVGAFDVAMKLLNENNLIEVLNEKVLLKKTPILGICLGMQLLTNYSEEGNADGLGWINAITKKFDNLADGLKVPHMGWNNITPINDSELIRNLNSKSKFYFVHSYYVKCKNSDNVICQTNHGVLFDSLICKDNIYGAQFHPERSHKFGMKLLENFSRI